MAEVMERLKHAWNAFSRPEVAAPAYGEYGVSSGSRPDRGRVYIANERSIISSIYTRLAVDVAAVKIRHIRLDDQKRYTDDIDSGLNNCLTLAANLDQGARHFRQDVAQTLFDKGVAAIVPVDTSLNPNSSGGYDIKTMRCGDIVAWFPKHVRVSLYNEKIGRRQEITLPKSMVAIVENPLYSIMNEPNSTLQRLIRKLSLLDKNDDAVASGKLDLIIQLPYVIKTEARRQQAMQRARDIEFQLKTNQYGIAYADGSEKITQLNRPAENNLLKQIEYLQAQLYSQLGLTAEIMNGTADEKAMLNYMNRTVEPIVDAIVEAMRPKFLTKTGRAQGQWIDYFLDPFKLVPLNDIAEIADKFTRNEILAANEIRGLVGFKPSKEKKADQLINSNMPVGDTGVPTGETGGGGGFDEINSALDDVFKDLGVDLDEAS